MPLVLEPAAFIHFRRGPVSAAGILNTASVLGPGERGRDFEYCLCFDDNQQYHFNGGKVLVKDWLYRNFPREDKEFLKQQYRIIPEIGKLMRRIPEELRRASVFKILFYHYYNFDLGQPFLPQYEQNNRSLLHELRQLALLD